MLLSLILKGGVMLKGGVILKRGVMLKSGPPVAGVIDQESKDKRVAEISFQSNPVERVFLASIAFLAIPG